MNFSIWAITLIILSISVLFSSCSRDNTVCNQDVEKPKIPFTLDELISSTPIPSTRANPIIVEINGKSIEVNKLVDYPLCNDTWEGIVYVSCDAQVAVADLDVEENPLFFKGCNLDIQPNTIVYVAAHNDAAYYKGCSCHTGNDPVQ
jgi:hypothetical protein